MATSNSTEKCQATAAIFSGRPDPQWRVSRSQVQQLELVWKGLLPASGAPPEPPPLGYRGCSLNCGSRGVWFAYGGVVAHGADYRADPKREFERRLLGSAPKGAIPLEVLRPIG